MLKIDPIEEVIKKRSVVLTLDEDEIARVLVDARGLQKALRTVKSKWYGPAAYINNGHAVKKTREANKSSEKKTAKRGIKCPKCHKVFKKLGRHVATCTGEKDPFGATASSALDE